MFKFSAVSQIWKKYIQKLNDWDLPLNAELANLWKLAIYRNLFLQSKLTKISELAKVRNLTLDIW